MTTRPVTTPIKRFSVPNGQQPEQELLVVEARINGGMNTYVDPADLPNYQVVSARNIEIKADRARKRYGSEVITPTKPNSDPVLLYTQFKRFDGSTVNLRFTKNKIYRQSVGAWTEITSGSPFSISNTTRIRITTLNDRFFFSVGNKEIQEINFSANTYAALGNAGKYKYICGFFNRLVGANLYDSTSPNPVMVGWSGDLNFSQWNPVTDLSAGSTPLVEASTDFADPITGLFGFASVTLILRERSLWTVTKRPVASNPFQFQASYPFVGCDTPNSASQKQNGIVWYDSRANQVYDYTIGNDPIPIGNPIREELKSKITDLSAIMGAYDPINNRYHLLIPSSLSNDTYEYVFDYETQSWVENVRTNVVSVSSLDASAPTLTIDFLSGTIDALVGTIDSLTNTSISPPTLYYGLNSGDILKSTNTLITDNGSSFSSYIISKIYTAGRDDLQIARFSFRYKVVRSGDWTLYVSRDAGQTWESVYTETISSADVGKRKRATVAKNIRTPEFSWKIEMTSCNIEILEYGLEGIQTSFTKPF